MLQPGFFCDWKCKAATESCSLDGALEELQSECYLIEERVVKRTESEKECERLCQEFCKTQPGSVAHLLETVNFSSLSLGPISCFCSSVHFLLALLLLSGLLSWWSLTQLSSTQRWVSTQDATVASSLQVHTATSCAHSCGQFPKLPDLHPFALRKQVGIPEWNPCRHAKNMQGEKTEPVTFWL